MPDDSYEEFVRLMSVHQRQIWWFINTLLPAANDSDDVLQETSLVLWRKWDQYDRDREFLSWAIGIARLQVFKFVRENRSKRIYLNETVLGEIAATAEKQVRNKARVETRLDALRSCFKDLGGYQRSMIEDCYLRAMSPNQIAQECGKPIATVYTILRRARARLSECVNRRLSASEASL